MSAVGVALGGSLSSCGGGGGGGGGSTVLPSRVAQLGADPTFLIPAGSSVLSGTGRVALAANGSAMVKASTAGVQTYMCTDSAGTLRALSMGASATGPAAPSFSAASTAQALLFLCPGMIAFDSSTAAQRLSAINSLPSFPSLQAFIQANAGKTLQAYTATPKYTSLLDACITEYLSLHGDKPSTSTPDSNGFGVSLSFPPVVAPQFTNSSPRYLSIVLEQLAGGVTKETDAVTVTDSGLLAHGSGLLQGTALISAGTLVSTLLGAQNEGVGTAGLTYDSDDNVDTLRYWALGVGAWSADPPDNVSSAGNLVEACYFSLLYYIAFPAIDALLAGAGEIYKVLVDNIKPIWAVVQKNINVIGFVAALKQGGAALSGAVLDAFFAVLALGIALLEAGEVALAVPLAVAGAMLTAYATAAAYVNVGWALGAWLQSQTATSVDIPISGIVIGVS